MIPGLSWREDRHRQDKRPARDRTSHQDNDRIPRQVNTAPPRSGSRRDEAHRQVSQARTRLEVYMGEAPIPPALSATLAPQD